MGRKKRTTAGRTPRARQRTSEESYRLAYRLLQTEQLILEDEVWHRVFVAFVLALPQLKDHAHVGLDKDLKRLLRRGGMRTMMVLWNQSRFIPPEARALAQRNGEPNLDLNTPNALGTGVAIARRRAGHYWVSEQQFIQEQRRNVKAAVKFGLVERSNEVANYRPAIATKRLHELMTQFLDELAEELGEGVSGERNKKQDD